MPAIDQFWIYLLAALATGVGLGAYAALALTDRHARHNNVRWKRRVSELITDHELRIATLNKTLRHAEEKQAALRQALNESDETVRLLSADRVPAYEKDIAGRNIRIAELEKKVSHYRAEIADAKDQETVLQNQIDSLQIALQRGQPQIEDTLKGKPIKNSGAKVISLHPHPQTDDLISPAVAGVRADDTEQRIGAVGIELQNWKRNCETAKEDHDRTASEPINGAGSGAEPAGGAGAAKDNLKLIRGIGPVVETALNRLGFFQFEQLAGMNQSDIEQMARFDSSLPGRLQRYNWVEQAKKLHEARPPDQRRPRV